MKSISFVKDELIKTIQENNGNGFKKAVKQLESALIEEVLILNRGNQTKAAAQLGLNRGTLRKKMGVKQ